MGISFFTNMMIFQCWGLLYAILQALMSALQITDPMQFSGSFLQAFLGSSQMIVMSVASVLLSVMIALIPLVSSRIVRGDIGSTFMTLISGAITAGAAVSGLAMSGEVPWSRVVAPEAPPPPPPPPPRSHGIQTGSAGPAPAGSQVQTASSSSRTAGSSSPLSVLLAAAGKKP